MSVATLFDIEIFIVPLEPLNIYPSVTLITTIEVWRASLPLTRSWRLQIISSLIVKLITARLSGFLHIYPGPGTSLGITNLFQLLSMRMTKTCY